MSHYYSPDLFLEDIDIVVIFLRDGFIAHLPGYDSKGRVHESGDLVHVDRGVIEAGKGIQPAVILGWGGKYNIAFQFFFAV